MGSGVRSYEKPEDLLGEGEILKQLTQALVEPCLEAEMKTHLETQAPPTQPAKPANRCNGHSRKTIKGEFGEAQIAAPRDRDSKLEPVIVKNISKKWTMPIRDWRPALNQFAITYENRFPL